MLLQKIINKIESHEFSAELNITSNYSSFMQYLTENKFVVELKKLIENETNLYKIYKRVLEISEIQLDLRYENPFDTALCVYLWTIKSVNNESAYNLAKRILAINNCWWSKKYANDLLEEEIDRNMNSTDYTEFVQFLNPSKIKWRKSNCFSGISFLFDNNTDEFLTRSVLGEFFHNAENNNMTIKSTDESQHEILLKGLHQC